MMDYYKDKPYVCDKIERLRYDLKMLGRMGPFAAINYIRHVMGYEEYLKEYAEFRRMNAEDLMEVLNELQESARAYKTYDEWFAYMERYKKEMDEMRKRQQEVKEGVHLATMHSSKGLEYDTVYLLDVIDGILPDQIPKSLKNAPKEDIEAYEEDRRLFYVGVTRAKNRLLVFTMKNQPSKFCMELLGKEPEKKNIGATVAMGKFQQLNTRPESPKNISEEDYQTFVQQLDEGVIVTHKKFGKGVVVQMDETKVKIAFEKETKVFLIRVLAASGMVEV